MLLPPVISRFECKRLHDVTNTIADRGATRRWLALFRPQTIAQSMDEHKPFS